MPNWNDKVNWNDDIRWPKGVSLSALAAENLRSTARDLRANLIEQMHAVYLEMVGRFDDEFVYDDERQQMLEQIMRDLQAQHSELIGNDDDA